MSKEEQNYDWILSIYDLMMNNHDDMRSLMESANLDTVGGEVSYLDLSNLDLSGYDFSGWDLEHADFSDSNVADADFTDAKVNTKTMVKAKNWREAKIDHNTFIELSRLEENRSRKIVMRVFGGNKLVVELHNIYERFLKEMLLDKREISVNAKHDFVSEILGEITIEGIERIIKRQSKPTMTNGFMKNIRYKSYNFDENIEIITKLILYEQYDDSVVFKINFLLSDDEIDALLKTLRKGGFSLISEDQLEVDISKIAKFVGPKRIRSHILRVLQTIPAA